MAKIRKVRQKIAKGCVINNYRGGGISSVQVLNFCPVSDMQSWFDGLQNSSTFTNFRSILLCHLKNIFLELS